MSDAFQPLDLKAYLNAGTENVDTGTGWLWPAASERPGLSGLCRLPGGNCRFWGVPFALADRDETSGGPAFVVVSGRRSERVAGAVSIPVGRKARRVLFAHVCTPVDGTEASLEGTGEVVGRYRIGYASGTDVEQELRRRFEIHDLFVPWGHHPFLCRNCREFLPVALDDRTLPYGAAQVGVRSESSDLAGWWLYDWVNPNPEETIQSIEISASGDAAIALGGITLCQEENDPLAWHPRSEVAISTEDEDEIAVDMDRGVVARQDRLYVPGDDYLETDETGWGAGGGEVREGRYLEIHGSPKADMYIPVRGVRRIVQMGRRAGEQDCAARQHPGRPGRARRQAVAARSGERRGFRPAGGMPDTLPVFPRRLFRAARPPGGREYRLVRGYGRRLQGAWHAVRLHRRHLPGRTARGACLRGGGSRIRVCSPAGAGGRETRSAGSFAGH